MTEGDLLASLIEAAKADLPKEAHKAFYMALAEQDFELDPKRAVIVAASKAREISARPAPEPSMNAFIRGAAQGKAPQKAEDMND